MKLRWFGIRGTQPVSDYTGGALFAAMVGGLVGGYIAGSYHLVIGFAAAGLLGGLALGFVPPAWKVTEGWIDEGQEWCEAHDVEDPTLEGNDV